MNKSYIPAIQILKNAKNEDVSHVVNELNTQGMYSAEENDNRLSHAIKHWTESCEDYLRKYFNYNGGDLKTTGRYFPHCSCVYVMYDSEQYTFDEANDEVTRIGEQTKSS